MDRPPETAERELLEAALGKLAGWGLAPEIVALDPPVEGVHADALIRVQLGKRKVVMAVEVKRGLRPGTLGGTLLQLERLGATALLVADYVTPPLAQELKARGVAFVDAAGNAHLDWPPVLIWVKGERPPERPEAPAVTGRAFQPGGLRVLFALLCDPALVDRPYREIAQRAGVAHGTVGWVMAELPEVGHVAKVGGRRRLVAPERLLQQWTDAFARTLRPKLLLGRYQAESLEWWRALDPVTYGLTLGGEGAAARFTTALRPGTLTFYGPRVEQRLVLERRLKPHAAGNVEFLRRFWTFGDDPPGLAPDVLVYADLVATGDARCLEAARQLEGWIRARLGR